MIKLLPVSDLISDPRFQFRVSIQPNIVNDYASLLLENAKVFDKYPIKALLNDSKYYILDGEHRTQAFKKANISHIKVDIIEGSLEDGIIIALKANSEHGLPRTIEDKKKSVEYLFNKPEFLEKGKTEIAKLAGVSRNFVKSIAKELKIEFPKIVKTTRGGKEYIQNNPLNKTKNFDYGGHVTTIEDPLTVPNKDLTKNSPVEVDKVTLETKSGSNVLAQYVPNKDADYFNEPQSDFKTMVSKAERLEQNDSVLSPLSLKDVLAQYVPNKESDYLKDIMEKEIEEEPYCIIKELLSLSKEELLEESSPDELISLAQHFALASGKITENHLELLKLLKTQYLANSEIDALLQLLDILWDKKCNIAAS